MRPSCHCERTSHWAPILNLDGQIGNFRGEDCINLNLTMPQLALLNRVPFGKLYRAKAFSVVRLGRECSPKADSRDF